MLKVELAGEPVGMLLPEYALRHRMSNIVIPNFPAVSPRRVQSFIFMRRPLLSNNILADIRGNE